MHMHPFLPNPTPFSKTPLMTRQNRKSLVANIYGRYNLSKTCLTGGFFSVVIAVLFLWTVRFINEGLSMATIAYRVPGKRFFHINFERVGSQAPPIFYVLLITGWFILFARNFYASRLISGPINDLLYQESFHFLHQINMMSMMSMQERAELAVGCFSYAFPL
jgi:hypothetical protein